MTTTSTLPALRRVDPKGSVVLQTWRAGREAERRAQRRGNVFVSVRGYDAARHDNLTFGWTASSASANEDVRQALDVVRARSRDLAANNDYMRKFLRMCEINIVGPNGFTYKNLAMTDGAKPDQAARDALMLHFWRWSRRGVCEVTGRYSLKGLMKQLVKATARDGEYLLRMVRGRAAGNAYQFALQLLDIDRLDSRQNGEHNGNRVIMGIEVDGVGKPLAYHLYTKHPRDFSYINRDGQRIERVPAAEILHGGIGDRPEQLRYMPWAHTAMLRMEMLGKFQTAAVAAARKGAETFGVLEQAPDADPTFNPLADGGGGDDDSGDLGAQGEAYHTSLPGQWDTLPPGYKMSKYESAYPNALFGEFVKDALRGVASGLNVSYHSLGSNLEGVNLSSIRGGLIEERDSWMDLQDYFIEHVLDPVHDDWLRMALLAGAITLNSGKSLPAVKFEQFSDHAFTGRRWAWTDPAKEAAANAQAIRDGTKTRTQVAAEQGRDFYEIVDELAEEQAYASSKGVTLGDAVAMASTTKPSPAPAPDTEDEDEEAGASGAEDAAKED